MRYIYILLTISLDLMLTTTKLLQEIEQKAQSSQREIEVVKARMAGLQREARKAQITAKELSTLPKDANVWEGCGKM